MDVTTFTKINSKCNISLIVKWKSIKLLEDNRTENLDDLGYGNDFLNKTPKAQSMKEIIDKLDFIKIKNFCSVKDNVRRMRRQATAWEKIYAKETADKELLSKIYKELLKHNKKKTTQFKNRPKIWQFTRWQISTWKDVPHHILFSSVQFNCSVMSDSLPPHELQHARPPYTSPTPRVYPNSCPSSR